MTKAADMMKEIDWVIENGCRIHQHHETWLIARVKRLEAALEFYAQKPEEICTPDSPTGISGFKVTVTYHEANWIGSVIVDKGDKARQALSEGEDNG